MKRLNKPRLFLLELLVNLLFFSVCCAVCLALFGRSSALSRESAALSRATFAAESAAESWKAENGDLDAVAALLGGAVREGAVVTCYDADWHAADAGIYSLTLRPDEGEENLRIATIEVDGADGKKIYSLTVKRAVR